MTSGTGYLTALTPPVETNRVREDEFARSEGSTLEDALRQLRPELMRTTRVVQAGSVVSVSPVVYLDQRYVGSLEILRLLSIAGVIEVQYLRPFAARGMFGTDCPCAGGAIVVATRTRRE